MGNKCPKMTLSVQKKTYIDKIFYQYDSYYYMSLTYKAAIKRYG